MEPSRPEHVPGNESGNFPAGRQIAQYQIVGKLGAGGMGVVYKALDTRLNRLAALKFLPPQVQHNAELKQRLTDEARAASALDHPNIVVIYDIAETPGGELFIAMAFHDGVTLRDRIASGLTVAESLQIARQIASGLARVHQNGIFHRDIKPSNIMVAQDGVARIIDFGLAKSSDVTATLDGSARGTPIYMSPEQASGKPVDCRTDLWSLGAVLYEMLAGAPPYRGDTQLHVMRAIVDGDPPRLRDVRPEIPPAIDAIVSRAMQKDLAKRYPSAAEMERDLSAALTALEGFLPARSGLRAVYAISAAALIVLAATASIWFYQRSERRHWAREQAIPEIARLVRQDRPVAAFLLLKEAELVLPGDPQLAKIAEGLTHPMTVRNTPQGALIEIKDYLSPGDPWTPLGTTPLENVKVPIGYLRWRASKAGVGEILRAPPAEDIHGLIGEIDFPLDLVAATPAGMVPVPAADFTAYSFWFGFMGPYALPAFYVDRFEVTNKQYQEFVDKGGYQKREYWKEPFLREGRALNWEQAMDLLRDTTGRPGPATWEAGHYPAGQAEYPVGGVSWYESAAYAKFAGKSLPVLAQWYSYAPAAMGRFVTAKSNFTGPAPVGKYDGLGAWGTQDTGGSLTEWCWNGPGGDPRYVLGGAWDTPVEDYAGPPVALRPFDRNARNGFRCVRNTAPVPAPTQAPLPPFLRDFSKAKPISDELFRAYQAMYAYDRTPLNAKRESVEQDSPDWRKEEITFDAAYGNERVTTYLFVPTNVRPPYQAVVYFPSAKVLDLRDSTRLADMNYIDYVVKSGRAVLYPIYKGTYERSVRENFPINAAGRELIIQQYKDLARALDYLETRKDIDPHKTGFLGYSMGSEWGVIMTTLDDRFQAVVFLDGGFDSVRLMAGADPFDFVARLKKPVLMINGKFDWVLVGHNEMFHMLGTPEADKRSVLLETGHNVADRRADLVQEVTAWYDKYLGRVN